MLIVIFFLLKLCVTFEKMEQQRKDGGMTRQRKQISEVF